MYKRQDIDRVDIVGQAVLFETALYAKLPDDISEPLALAALDVISDEANTRLAGDTALQVNIDKEVADRKNADTLCLLYTSRCV